METICRWESGGLIQSRAMDNLLRVYFSLPQVRKFLARGTADKNNRRSPAKKTGLHSEGVRGSSITKQRVAGISGKGRLRARARGSTAAPQ